MASLMASLVFLGRPKNANHCVSCWSIPFTQLSPFLFGGILILWVIGCNRAPTKALKNKNTRRQPLGGPPVRHSLAKTLKQHVLNIYIYIDINISNNPPLRNNELAIWGWFHQLRPLQALRSSTWPAQTRTATCGVGEPMSTDGRSKGEGTPRVSGLESLLEFGSFLW